MKKSYGVSIMSKKNIKKWLHLVVDKSMSIKNYGLESKIKELIDSLINEHASDNLDNILEVTFFSSEFLTQKVYEGLVSDAKYVKNKYIANGPSTAIISATYNVLNRIKMISSAYKDDIHVVMVLTDGAENSSSERYKSLFSQQIKEVVNCKNSKTTLIFQCPKSGIEFLEIYGVDRDNILAWEQTNDGVEFVKYQTSVGLNSFYSSVNNYGVSNTRKFYVQPDLSNINSKEIQQKLDDLSHLYGIFTCRIDCKINEVVEQFSKRPYKAGLAFYQLTKPETVQSNKEILIFDKQNTELYGGKQARKLLGLPDSSECKLLPEKHKDRYEIFVQSNSHNRKIKSGNKIVIKNQP